MLRRLMPQVDDDQKPKHVWALDDIKGCNDRCAAYPVGRRYASPSRSRPYSGHQTLRTIVVPPDASMGTIELQRAMTIKVALNYLEIRIAPSNVSTCAGLFPHSGSCKPSSTGAVNNATFQPAR